MAGDCCRTVEAASCHERYIFLAGVYGARVDVSGGGLGVSDEGEAYVGGKLPNLQSLRRRAAVPTPFTGDNHDATVIG